MQSLHIGDTKRRRWRLEQNGRAIPLDSATTVTLHCTPRDAPGAQAFTSVLDIVSRPTGIVRWAPQSQQVAVAGLYYIVFVITWNDGTTETVPDGDYESLRILP